MKVATHHKPVEIYPAALWAKRHTWRNVAHFLPRNSCLLVMEGKNKRQTALMRQVAQSFRSKGQSVLIWMFPKQETAVNNN